MRRFIYPLLMLLALCSGKGFAQVEGINFTAEDLKGFGYADKNVEASNIRPITRGISEKLFTMIQLPALEGDVIKGITFVANRFYDEGAIFILSEDHVVLSTNKVSIKKGVNTHTFKKPITIPANKRLFVGYQIQANGKWLDPICFDRKEAIRQAGWFGVYNKTIKEGERLPSGPGADPRGDGLYNVASEGWGSALVFADIEDKGNYLNKIAFLIDVKGSYVLRPNEETKLKAIVRNLGRTDISKEEFSYKIGTDRGKINTEVSIPVGKTVEIPFPITRSQEENAALVLKLPKLDDASNTLGGYSSRFPFQVIKKGGAFAKHSVVLEQFTSEKCVNCPGASPAITLLLEKLAQAGYTTSFVQHHSGYYTDFLTLPEGEALLPYLGITGAPSMTVDRIIFRGQVVPSIHPKALTPTAILEQISTRLQYGTFTTIKQSFENGQLMVEANGEIVNGVDPNNLYITAIVTEAEVESKNQVGTTDPDYMHHGVARAFLSPFNGLKANVSGNKFSLKFPAKAISEEWDKNGMKVVLIATTKMDAYNEKQYFSREVLFSTNVDFATPLATNKIAADKQPIAYGIDGYIHIKGLANSFEVYNINGQLVATDTTTKLATGFYIVKISNEFGKFISKVWIR